MSLDMKGGLVAAFIGEFSGDEKRGRVASVHMAAGHTTIPSRLFACCLCRALLRVH